MSFIRFDGGVFAFEGDEPPGFVLLARKSRDQVMVEDLP
jgi:hypothetical protein